MSSLLKILAWSSLMGFISVVERKVEARGAVRSNFDLVDFSVVEFSDSLAVLDVLDMGLCGSISDAPLLFYPGCGCDVVFPLEYVRRLWPKVRMLSCVFVDATFQQGLIETVLDTLGISFAREENVLMFYWGDILVRLRVIRCDVFSFIDRFTGFDIYFERAFRIMKDGWEGYEEKVVLGLNPCGIVISDSGFRGFDSVLSYIPVSCDLSVYGEMVIGRKK